MPDVRYAAQLPWIGPQVGDVTERNSEKWLAIGGGSDPALGQPLMVAFVPVAESGDRFVAVDAQGTARGVVEVGWVQECKSNGPRRLFTVDAPASGWDGQITGVLVVLVYNQSGRLSQPSFPQTYPGQLEFLGAPKTLVPSKPTPIASLPGAMRDETRDRLDALLAAEPARRLRKGLTRLP